jgi:ubiquinone/menaquinone biosynthesis C-methylase UbiE
MATDWEGTALAYDRSFARLTAGTVQPMLSALLERSPRPRNLLDVGTGTGNVAAAAAELGIETEGVDADRSMIALASQRHPRVRFSLGSLPDLPYPGEHFHAVTANFVMNLVTEPVASIRELRRVVAPGGPVAVTIWPAPVNAMNRLWNDVIEKSGATPLIRQRLAAELDFDRTGCGVIRLLNDGGFSNAAAHEVTWSFDISPAELWLAVTGGIATIGHTYRTQTSEARQRMSDAFLSLTAGMTGPDGELHLPSTAILAVAN